MTRPPIRGQTQKPLPSVFLLTDDVANRQKAEKEDIPCFAVRQYLKGHKNVDQLSDLLAVQKDDTIEPKGPAGRQAVYPEYLSTGAVLAGVKAGKLHQGHFNANEFNYLEV